MAESGVSYKCAVVAVLKKPYSFVQVAYLGIRNQVRLEPN